MTNDITTQYFIQISIGLTISKDNKIIFVPVVESVSTGKRGSIAKFLNFYTFH